MIQGYRKLGQHQKAADLIDPLLLTKDKLLNESKIREVTKMELTTNFEHQKRIDSLANAQSIALLEKDKEVLTANNRIIALGLGGASLIAILTMFGFFRLRKQNRIISEQKSTLEELNLIKDQIFAIIGHDLRKPALAFNGISKKVNYLLQKKDFESLDKLGAQIEANGFSLQKIIDNLLNWALAQRSVVPYNPEVVDLSELADDLYQSVMPRLSEKGISFISKIEGSKEVWSDKNSLYTLLLNLIDNAIKYTPDNGEVIIDAIEMDDRLKISVQRLWKGNDRPADQSNILAY